MLNFRSSAHIRTSMRNANGFRSCSHSMGVSLAPLEMKRIAREEKKLASREERRLWLEAEWIGHFERAQPFAG